MHTETIELMSEDIAFLAKMTCEDAAAGGIWMLMAWMFVQDVMKMTAEHHAKNQDNNESRK